MSFLMICMLYIHAQLEGTGYNSMSTSKSNRRFESDQYMKKQHLM